jgi:hypothetical protein
LFDTSLDFDALAEDYFSFTYGEEWKEVYSFLSELGKAFDHEYLEGKRSSDTEKGKYYAPEHADDIRRAKKLIAEFRPFCEAHKNMPMRAQTVAYRLLMRYLDYCEGLADVMILKCLGADAEAVSKYAAFLNEFGKYEIEIERYYDQSLYAMTYGLYIDICRGALKEQKKALNV